MREEESFVDTIMNPVRIRIIQYFILHGRGTVRDLKEELGDVPPASLYRHIKVLSQGNILEVLEEKKVRGTVERTYGLNRQPVEDPSPDSLKRMIDGTLIAIRAEFARYLEREDRDLEKDGVGLSTSILLLSDQELYEMTARIGAVLNDYLGNRPSPGRKPRRFTTVISPPDAGEKVSGGVEGKGADIKDAERKGADVKDRKRKSAERKGAGGEKG